ncbi:MAG: hypothetical protein M3046_16760 [Actinomycetota bacterium]|nr:hypothetical protein [Actinomycetota bacterium]
MAAAALVMTAGAAAAADRGTGTALAAQKHKSRTVTFTETDTGAQISQNGSMSVSVTAFTNSLDGDGAAETTATLNGDSGTDTTIAYMANGVGRYKDTFTLGAPDASGMIPMTGSGKCAGGTGVHKHEKCSFTFTGTDDPQTTVYHLDITGTSTR